MVNGQQRTATAEDARRHNAEIGESKAKAAYDNSLAAHQRMPDSPIEWPEPGK